MKKVFLTVVALCCFASVAEARPHLLRRLMQRMPHPLQRCKGGSCSVQAVTVGHIDVVPVDVYEAPVAVPTAPPSAYAR